MVAVVAAAEEVMMVDPLNGEVAEIQLVVDSLALDDADPMVVLMTLMTRKISSLSLQQVTSKKQNTLYGSRQEEQD